MRSNQRNLRRWLVTPLVIFVTLYALINYRWVHAAMVAVASDKCSEELLLKSNEILKDYYGRVTSEPIVACVTGSKMGLNISHGRTNFAPGLPSVVLIGPEGTNVDVMSHELAHAEIVSRVGLVYRELFIPTWFEEGLAMQVDKRKDYDIHSYLAYRQRADLHQPKLVALKGRSFFVPGDQGKLHYALSRCVVGDWIVKNPDWIQRLETIDALNGFPVQEFDDLCRED